MAVQHSVRWALTCLILTISVVGCSGSESPVNPNDFAIAEGDVPEFGYDAYNRLLIEHVDVSGQVDYAALAANRRPLDGFIASMGQLDPAVLASWPAEEQIALWINAYNAITLQFILNHYPIQKGGIISGAIYPANSIRQIPGIWDTMTSPVAGSPVTLDEPRIHVAIVCASVGCPPLRNEAFVADRLNEQLDDQARRFLADPSKFNINRERKVVTLSPILDWFGKDFAKKYGTGDGIGNHDPIVAATLRFVSNYVADADAVFLESESFSVKFADYDWSLNEQ